jgi:Spy/CpxP family protein refolding chaperone
MKPKLAPRVQAIVLLLLVATSSALAGIVGDRLITDRHSEPAAGAVAPANGAGDPSARPGPWQWEPRVGMRYGERLHGALDLTPAQRAAIDSIVAEQQREVRQLNEEIRPRFRAIAEQTRDRIEDVLTEEQRIRLRALREERVRTLRDDARPGRHELMQPGEAPRLRERRDAVRRDPALRDSLRRERTRTQRPDTSPSR